MLHLDLPIALGNRPRLRRFGSVVLRPPVPGSVLRHARRLHRAHALRSLAPGAGHRAEPRVAPGERRDRRPARAPRPRRPRGARALCRSSRRETLCSSPRETSSPSTLGWSGLQRRSRSTGSTARAGPDRTLPETSFPRAPSWSGPRPRRSRRRRTSPRRRFASCSALPTKPGSDRARTTAWWQRLARAYVAGVLVLAAGRLRRLVDRDARSADALSRSPPRCSSSRARAPSGSPRRSPTRWCRRGCAGAASSSGRASFLDRALDVRRVVFDKTGTLTTGALVLAQSAGAGLAARGAAAGPLRPRRPQLASEERGRPRGVRDGRRASTRRRASSSARAAGSSSNAAGASGGWATRGGRAPLRRPRAPRSTSGFTVDGQWVAGFRTAERLRPDAERESSSALERDGYEVSLLSGDAQARVDAAADSVRPAARARLRRTRPRTPRRGFSTRTTPRTPSSSATG